MMSVIELLSVIFLLTLVGNIETKSDNSSEEVLDYFSNTKGVVAGHRTDDDLYPTVNKCCPFHWRYANGKCVKVDTNSTRTTEAPKTIVTLAKDFQGFNMTDILGDPIVFRLRVAQPTCKTAKFEKIVHNELLSKMDNSDPVVALSPKGYLLWSDESGYVHQISYQDFCIDQVSPLTYVAVLCSPACDETHPCVRKCCNPDQVLFNNTCTPSTKLWEPFLYKSPGERVPTDSSIRPHFKIGTPKCKEMYELNLQTEPFEKVFLLLNGTLVVVDSDGKKNIWEPDRFCLDGAATFSAAYSDESLDYPDYFELGHYSGHERDQTAILCYMDEPRSQEPEGWRLMLYGCVALISSFFLLLTALVYIILWEYQNIHGWLQFCYVISLLLAFTFLAIVQLSSSTIQEISLVCCEVIGGLIHFLFLSAFFWLTSMNFDLWWTFSGCRPLRTGSSNGEKKRFFCFALFSYGFPCFIAGTGLVLDSMFRGHPYIITPRFGERNCYFFGDKEKLPYFYAPVGVLLTVNSVFFISTIYSLHKLQNDTKFATRQSSKQEKKRFLLFMKLFVVMGVLWIFEVISWATSMLNPQENHFIKNIFLPTDLLNGAQGVAIFIIFTCKPNTCRLLESQFKKFTVYLQEQREKRSTGSTSMLRLGRLIAGICMVIIPIVNRLRGLLSFCCQVTRSLEGRRNMSHTNTITSTTFDKSRKLSEVIPSTVSHNGEIGSIELDMTSHSHYNNANYNPK